MSTEQVKNSRMWGAFSEEEFLEERDCLLKVSKLWQLKAVCEWLWDEWEFQDRRAVLDNLSEFTATEFDAVADIARKAFIRYQRAHKDVEKFFDLLALSVDSAMNKAIEKEVQLELFDTDKSENVLNQKADSRYLQ